MQHSQQPHEDQDVLDAIRNRRSVRRFTRVPVPDELMDRILEAAQRAPSACNEQPWHFVLIEDRDVLDKLATRHPFGAPVRNAPLCVIPCADLRLATVTLQAGDFWAQSMSAATENLLLAAHACGLGAVWIGTYPDERRVAAVREVIGAPDHIVPFCLVPIGYPAETPPARGIASPDRIHRDHW